MWKYRLSKKEQYRSQYKTYSERLKKIISLTRTAKNNYYVTTASNKARATWKAIKHITVNKPNEEVTKLIYNNKPVRKAKTIAQIFNENFIKNPQYQHRNNKFLNYMPKQVPFSMFL